MSFKTHFLAPGKNPVTVSGCMPTMFKYFSSWLQSHANHRNLFCRGYCKQKTSPYTQAEQIWVENPS